MSAKLFLLADAENKLKIILLKAVTDKEAEQETHTLNQDGKITDAILIPESELIQLHQDIGFALDMTSPHD